MRKQPSKRQLRRGISLLVCLFVIGITSVLIIGILETNMIQMSASNNTTDYERALYLAGAGVHHALAEIELDADWRGTIPATEFPKGSGDTYWATVVDGRGNHIVVTGVGVSGRTSRKLSVTVQP